MAAVSAPPIHSSSHIGEKNPHLDEPSTGFMAVNGREPVSHGLANTNGSPKLAEDTSKVGGEPRESQTHTNPTSRQPTPASRSENPHTEHVNGNQIEPSHPVSGRSSPGAHKRKRSQSDEGGNTSSSGSSYNQIPPTYPGQAPVRPRNDPRYQQARPGEPFPPHHPYERERHAQPSYPYNGNGPIHPESSPWQERPPAPHPSYAPNGARMDHSEARLLEALQRDNHGQETPSRWGVPTRSEPDSGDGEHYGSYSQDGTPQASGQTGNKRKRVFSNRTKTGCQTCRRRKKKCDEQHPECNNCIRGGFECQGYTQKQPWPKRDVNQKPPVPLQSKDGYPEPGEHTYKIDDTSPSQSISSLSRDGTQARLVVMDENENPHVPLTASPTSAGPRSRGSYPGPAWSQPGNPSYASERSSTTNHRPDLPSFSELTQHNNPRNEFAPMPPMQQSRPSPMHNPSQPQQGPPPAAQVPPPTWSGYPVIHEYRPSYPPAPQLDTSNLQNTARLTLGIEQQQPTPRSTTLSAVGDAERTKMMNGVYFRFSDPTLVEERSTCKAALSRFNNYGSTQTGSRDDEIASKLIKDVIIPQSNQGFHGKPVGHIGHNTVVETPFKCHYGYNIHLGDKVHIGENCTLIDACKITIGPETSIGVNVTILTARPHEDNIFRKGFESTWQGKEVKVEREVIVGANVIIYPGVTLGLGCTVEPGAIVREDVPAGMVCAPLPTYLRKRGDKPKTQRDFVLRSS